jgi:hypothetical protein
VHVLEDPAYRVPVAPPAATGMAWLRGAVVRFSEGEDHTRRRSLIEDLLDAIPPSDLRKPGEPAANLAAALGLPHDPGLVADVDLAARSYQPHTEQTPEADTAVERLVDRFGGAHDEATAARICVLVQAHAATAAMVAGQDPPVPATRRIDPSGAEVEVDLTGLPFGAGRHRCPGEAHALALVEGARAGHDGAHQ